ncbi:hypothetical protein [uncultured Campylobacter sp.]|uniref:hypothetical protein n=1 Tax=uncultured Campylobacter sp. TaxID=218934 RepID=UPI00263A0FFC|nr:hypothetical protein [uncultured Campylobacter sp.]
MYYTIIARILMEISKELFPSKPRSPNIKGFAEEQREREEAEEKKRQIDAQLYKDREIERIQNKYDIEISPDGLGFENRVLKSLEEKNKEIRNEIKRLQELKNALE